MASNKTNPNSDIPKDSRDIADCDPILQDNWAQASSIYKDKYPDDPQPFLTQTYRSPVRQQELYDQPTDGKDNDGDGKIDEADEKVTNAKAGQSKHGLYPSWAYDIAFKKKGSTKLYWDAIYFKRFADIAKSLNPRVRWGGDFRSLRDLPHFEI